MTTATDSRLLIIIRATDAESGCLSACLKTLELNPPSLDYDIVVLIPRDKGGEITKLLSGIDKIRTVEYPDLYGAGVNSVVAGTSHQYLLFLHPDILFVKDQWCDAILSRMVQNQLGMIGTTPFEAFETREGNMQAINDCFMIAQRHYFEVVDGFSEKLDLHGGNFIIQMRMRRNSIPVAGAELSGYIAHMGLCKRDKEKATNEELSTIRQIFIEEKLYMT